jgi:hypothetical protein
VLYQCVTAASLPAATSCQMASIPSFGVLSMAGRS